jgi:hypothetical protein
MTFKKVEPKEIACVCPATYIRLTDEVLTTEVRVSIPYPCPLGYITYTLLRSSSHN